MNLQLTLLKGVQADLPEAQRVKIKECEEKVRALLAEYGDEGLFALALLGAEKSE